MRFFSRLFNKRNKKAVIPPIPPLSEIVELMFDKSLSFPDDVQVTKVIYSCDKTKRFILLKNTNGYYKYTYEELRVCDEEEWMYFYDQENACPALWEPKDLASVNSFFGTEKEAVSELFLESKYKQYFKN